MRYEQRTFEFTEEMTDWLNEGGRRLVGYSMIRDNEYASKVLHSVVVEVVEAEQKRKPGRPKKEAGNEAA